ncbi:MAG TPA: radical SAM family heme chaperone HemW [Acidimicrobiia bacterium]|nr:radical SAM family heme chaperone HemW [Acidimicrobiia bacterium]
MTPEAADGFVDSPAAYVHIPFCSAICPYCDFAVVAGKDHLVGRYVDAVCAEIDAERGWRPLESVYFGGGTPSHVDPGHLERIMAALSAKHGITAGAELSLEANPEDFSAERAAQLLAAGFNRVSFGAQSFDSEVLASLGRRHVGADIARSVAAARAAGFGNVSIDLIFGTPGEPTESWLRSLRTGIALEPDHMSCYALTVEPGTPLGRSVRDGAPSPDPDIQADRYELADRELTAAGLDRYEVSNWARPGNECRYNLTVWAQGEYVAYGNGAHGFRDGRRYRNHRRLDAYIDRVETGRSPRAGADRIEDWDAEIDRLFVGLRRRVGVSSGPGTETLLAADEGTALLEAGVISEENGRVVVTKPLLTDAVLRSVLGQTVPNVMVESDA